MTQPGTIGTANRPTRISTKLLSLLGGEAEQLVALGIDAAETQDGTLVFTDKTGNYQGQFGSQEVIYYDSGTGHPVVSAEWVDSGGARRPVVQWHLGPPATTLTLQTTEDWEDQYTPITLTLQTTEDWAGPSMTTVSASNVTPDSAELTGELTDLGAASSVDVFVQYRESGATAWQSTPTTSKTSTGQYTDSATGLNLGTTYEFRAAAQTRGGATTGTGATQGFATPDVVVAITGTNSPVEPGNVLDVTADITNTGSAQSATVELVVDGAQRDSESLSLGTGETLTRTLSWNTGSNDDGDYQATVQTADAGDSVGVNIATMGGLRTALARWKFEQNTDDTVGSADGTDNTGLGYTTNNKVATYAKLFDTTTDGGVEIGSSFYKSAPITYTAWVYHNGSSARQTVISAIDAAMNRAYALVINSENLLYEYNGEGSTIESSFTIPTQTWTFVGVAIDSNGDRTFYKNDQSETKSGSLGSIGDASTIIGSRNAGGWNINGRIDDARVFSSALPEDEAKTLYNNPDLSGTYTPTNPATVYASPTIDTGDPKAIDSTAKGDHLVAVGKPDVSVIDITNPTSPTVVGTIAQQSDFGGMYGVKIKEPYAYITDPIDNQQLNVVDISDKTNPTRVQNVSVPGARRVATDGNYAFVSSADGEFHSIDISDPPNATKADAITSLNSDNRAFEITTIGDVAYMANRIGSSGGQLEIIDISDPTNMSFVASYQPSSLSIGPYGLEVDESIDTIYGTSATESGGDEYFYSIDVSTRGSPVLRDSLKTSDLTHPYGLDLYNNKSVAVVSARESETITTIDISDPDNLSQIAAANTSGSNLGPYDSEAVGSYVFTVRRGTDELYVTGKAEGGG